METWKKLDAKTSYLETKDGAVLKAGTQIVYVPGGLKSEIVVPPSPPIQWDQIQDMAYDPNTGEYDSTNTTGMGYIGMLRKKLVGVDYGKTVVVQFERRNKHPRIANLKFLRVWNDFDGVKYPNFYIGQPGGTSGSWLFLYTELLKIDKTTNHLEIDPTKYPIGDDQWHKERYFWKYPSAFGKSDGWFNILIDNQLVLDVTSWQCEGLGDDGKEYRGLPYDLMICTYAAEGSERAGYPLPVGSYTKVKNVSIEVF